MKTSIPALSILLGWALAAWPAAPGTLTTLRAVHALTNAEASHALPVAFEATVTFYDPASMNMTVQDDGVAIYVYASLNIRLVPGDRVLVRGTTQDSFRPIVVSRDITLLSHGASPKPVQATFDEMIRGDRDCMLVTVSGIVRAADFVPFANGRIADLQLLLDGGNIEALVKGNDPSALKDMLDSKVEITGVVSGKFDGKKHLTGAALYVQSFADVRILERAGTDFESLPVTPMDQILAGYHIRDFTRRIRVQGTVTYYQPGVAVVLESGAQSLWISTQTDQPLRIGDLVDASGFPDVTGGYTMLTRGEILDTHTWAPIAPRPVTWSELSSGWNGFDLVSTEGQVLMAVREATQDEYVLVYDRHLFSAIYRHPAGVSESQLPPMKDIHIGSKIRVTGICMLFSSDPLNGPTAFDLLLRSSDDVTLIAEPSWLSIPNLMMLVGLLLAVVVAVGTRSWTIERKVRRENADLAYVEQRRSRILEEINGARPLAEVIDQITELVSFKLQGAPCWCQVADGVLLGNCPSNQTAFRVVREDIPAHSGPALGVIFAAFDPLAKPQAIESQALTMAASLAALAIETSRLYIDLLHRSQFDQLTNTHNRFSLDKLLDTLIADASSPASIFGLIYMDLDKFKEINDLYGHQVGDKYLQEVALRMKSQLRSHDRLARLGGDEFAALVPEVRNRAEVEEIAQRLERCLDVPFMIEGNAVLGAASVGIALFPEDGASKDILFKFADAAMYSVKNSRRPVEQTHADASGR